MLTIKFEGRLPGDPIETFVFKCGCGVHPLSLVVPNLDTTLLAKASGEKMAERMVEKICEDRAVCKQCGRALTARRCSLDKYFALRERLMSRVSKHVPTIRRLHWMAVTDTEFSPEFERLVLRGLDAFYRDTIKAWKTRKA